MDAIDQNPSVTNKPYRKIGVLLINLGTPQEATVPSIRTFLREFLSDPRVMGMSTLARQLILNLFILPRRPAKIREKYRSIWSEEGSPLHVNTQKLTAQVAHSLGDEYIVEFAMRYGEPSMKKGLINLTKEGISHLIVLPLFPQYASATTGSVLEKLFTLIKHWKLIPELSIISQFYAHPLFIEAWVKRGLSYIEKPFDHVLFSFHNLPEQQILDGDLSGTHCMKKRDCCESIGKENVQCYRAQCFHTAHEIAKGLKIPQKKYSIAFQSKMGKSKWMDPSTTEVITKLAEEGRKKLILLCPSFVSDCLETLEEIAMQEKENFIAAGGEALQLVPSLNTQSAWVEAICEMVREKTERK